MLTDPNVNPNVNPVNHTVQFTLVCETKCAAYITLAQSGFCERARERILTHSTFAELFPVLLSWAVGCWVFTFLTL